MLIKNSQYAHEMGSSAEVYLSFFFFPGPFFPFCISVQPWLSQPSISPLLKLKHELFYGEPIHT